jgi:hypothetical protein
MVIIIIIINIDFIELKPTIQIGKSIQSRTAQLDTEKGIALTGGSASKK